MKRVLKGFMAIALIFSSLFALAGCRKDDDPPATSYTVTEEQWKTNLNLTRNQSQVQPVSNNLSQELTAITSYTVHAEGVNAGIPGSALLKMAPNGMSIEFYVNGSLKASESGTFDSDNVLYESVKTNMMMFVPFAEYYDDFTFDETKKAYVAQNLTATLVDDYDTSRTETIYHKSAEVSFVDGVLKTVSFEMSDKNSVENDNNFDNVIATFTFTFSDINSTTVETN